MKKSLIALAALATVATAAQAQSSVTVYGIADAGVRVDSKANSAGDSKTSFGNGVLSTSRLGFRGTEDLGGGKKANFNLESGININTGATSQGATSLFDRAAWVGVADANLGEVQLGRNTNAGVHIIGLINADGVEFEGNGTPFVVGTGVAATNGGLRVNQVLSILGNTTQLGTTRSDNQVKYLNKFGGVNLVATYGIGGVAGDADKKKSTSFGANTTLGNVTLAAAAFEAQDSSAKKLKYVSGGGNISMGSLKLFAGYSKIEQDAAYGAADSNTRPNLATAGTSQYMLLASASNGAEGEVVNLGAQYSWDAKNLSTLSYFDGKYKKTQGATGEGDVNSVTFTQKYSLSKRTTAYVSVDYIKVDGAVKQGNNDKATGYGVGLLHTF